MSKSFAAGVSCSGAPEHRPRLWCEGPDRVLGWRDCFGGQVLKLPVPGTAPVVAFDAFRGVAVLNDGAGWWLDTRSTPQWRQCKEADVKPKDGPVFISGGACCGSLWVVTGDRRVWAWAPVGRSPVGHDPVPGTNQILAVDVKTANVVLGGGERFAWLANPAAPAEGRWVRLPGPLEGSGTVRVRCLSGTVVSGSNFIPGEERELPESEALPLIAAGRAEVAT